METSETNQSNPSSGDIATVLSDEFRPVFLNLSRVSLLLELRESLEQQAPGRIGGTEVLRAAVVLLHASLEEFTRELVRRLLPHADAEALGKIPMLGSGNKEKSELGDLAKHRGKTVTELLQLSVEAMLERKTFNHTTEIKNALKPLIGWPAECDMKLEPLEPLMQRRHEIAHRGDLILHSHGEWGTMPIASQDVAAWHAYVILFVFGVLEQAVADEKWAKSTKFSN